ncbi:MAG TPA: universal stress protein [Bacteroidales bacterium]
MDSTNKNILVPWDFTPSATFGLEWAVKIAKVRNYNISLLHIVEHTKEEAKYQTKLQEIATENQKKSGIPTSVLIQTGDVLTTISELASLPDTELVIMKTDGISGMQKYFGSRAMKIMRGSKSPFVVVQKSPEESLFSKVVYPIDYRSENKEVVSNLLNLSKFYPFKVYIFKAQTNDKVFKKNVANNLNFARMMFESKHIEFEIFEAKGKMEYAAEVNNYAQIINADLIIIQLQRNLTLSKFIFGVKEQAIVANPYKIPVMVLNPKEIRVYAGFK